MATLTQLIAKLDERKNLSPDEVQQAAEALGGIKEPDHLKAEFLIALDSKRETPTELACLAKAFRALALNPEVDAWSSRSIDIVGTGGDHAGGFNISSMVVLVLASAGVKVMKHGNRGITSRCGSADLLAGLGLDLDAPPEKSRAALAELGYAFFFAPNYHPAFRRVATVRKTLAAEGRRTVFNILGPLVNPGRPAYILLGVLSLPLLEKMSRALQDLGLASGLVGHGVIAPGKGIDELTTATVNHVRGVGKMRTLQAIWKVEDLGLRLAPFSELQGGDVTTNLAIVDALLAGRGPAGLVDTIALNAAVAMNIMGRTTTIQEGLAPARDLLLGGAVAQKIKATREFYAAR